MQKKQFIWVIMVTVAMILSIGLLIGLTIHSVDRKVMQYSFDELETASESLADELYDSVQSDRMILSAMATIIAGYREPTRAQLCEVLKSCNTAGTYISYIELLMPGNLLLHSNGTMRDVNGVLSFEEETRNGIYISGIQESVLYPGRKVIRNVVPVVVAGKTDYILYGTVILSDFAKDFRTDLYGGNTYVLLENGDTGEFLVDTWHAKPGNIRDYNDRKMLAGYSFDKAIRDMETGVGGSLGFISHTTGKPLYMHYEPVGINNWNVIIAVEEQYAFEKTHSVSSALYRMAGLMAGILLVYMSFVGGNLLMAYKKVQKVGAHDQSTGLMNRNAYDKYMADSQNRTFGSVTCLYLDMNGLHEINNRFGHRVGDRMLCTVAGALRDEFGAGNVYRIGGDEFVAFCVDMTPEECREKKERVLDVIAAHEYSAAVGMVRHVNETGLDRVTQEADAAMLANKRQYYASRGTDENHGCRV